MSQKEIRACWVGGMRYSTPLPAGLQRKWGVLGGQAIRPFVVGFHERLRPAYFEQAGVAFYLLPGLPFSLLRYLLMFMVAPLLVLWVIVRRDAQVIVTQSPYEGAAGALAKMLARLMGKRVALVVESHGDFENAVFSIRRVFSKDVYKGVMQRAARFAIDRADALRPVSSSANRQLRAWRPAAPIHQFMAWVDTAVFVSDSRTVPPSACHDIIFGGMLTPIKNVRALLEAFLNLAARYPQTHLWLIGKAEHPDYANSLYSLAEQSAYAERIHFTGMLPQEQLVQHMAHGRVLVLPSVSEGLPRIMVEAMLTGLPVIASHLAGIPDVIENGVSGYLIEPGDQADLQRTLEAALTSPVIDVMSQMGKIAARRAFSGQTFAENYRRLLEDALERVGS